MGADACCVPVFGAKNPEDAGAGGGGIPEAAGMGAAAGGLVKGLEGTLGPGTEPLGAGTAGTGALGTAGVEKENGGNCAGAALTGLLSLPLGIEADGAGENGDETEGALAGSEGTDGLGPKSGAVATGAEGIAVLGSVAVEVL